MHARVFFLNGRCSLLDSVDDTSSRELWGRLSLTHAFELGIKYLEIFAIIFRNFAKIFLQNIYIHIFTIKDFSSWIWFLPGFVRLNLFSGNICSSNIACFPHLTSEFLLVNEQMLLCFYTMQYSYINVYLHQGRD